MSNELTPADLFAISQSRGASAVESTDLYVEGLSTRVVAEIRRQQATGDFRKIAGRPWWVTTFTEEELKKAGL
jgi:hypothetical protein